MKGIFIDIEANGLDPSIHYAIDIALKVIELETMNVLSEYSQIIRVTESDWKNSDSKSLEINGFTYDIVRHGKPIDLVQSDILSLFHDISITRDNSVFIAQNPSFDRVYFSKIVPTMTQEKLLWPYRWLDFSSMFYMYRYILDRGYICQSGELSKDSIASYLLLDTEKKPHRAQRGLDHLITCYVELFSKASS